MRKAIAIATSVAVIAAGVPYSPGNAQTVIPVVAVPGEAVNAVRAIFSAYPNGGPAMAAEIADLITRDPKVANEVLNYLKSSPRLNAEQRKAVQQGLTEALTRLKAMNQYDSEWDSTWIIVIVVLVVLLGGVGWYFWDKSKDDDKDVKASPN